MANRLIAVFSFLIASLAIVLAFRGSAEFNSNGLAVTASGETEGIVEIGDHFEGTFNGTFELRNVLDEDIHIRSVKKNCTCTKITSPTLVPKNGKVSIDYEWDMRGRGGTAILEAIFIYSSANRKNQELAYPVKIRANIIPDFKIVPESVTYFGDIGNSQSKIELVPVHLPNARILSVTSNHPLLNVTLLSENLFQISSHPNNSVGSPVQSVSEFGSVTVETNSKNRPLIEFPVFLRKD